MLSHEGVDTNICFLILEVRKQVQKTQAFLDTADESLIGSILSRDDYIDNLRSIIQRKCFAQVATLKQVDGPSVDLLKAYDVVSQNLERIADFCEDITDQAQHIEKKTVLSDHDFAPFFEEVLAGLDRIDRALFERNVQVALQVCRCEYNLDRHYAKRLDQTIGELEDGGDPHALVTMAFIYHYFERMGDALLNIGEAVISACLGERIKISRFWALEETLDDMQPRASSAPLSLQPMADTRSGSRISRVQDGTSDRSRAVIFKEGRLNKLLDEKRNIERWHEVMPGLAPRIHSFHEYGDSGSTLFEYLPGQTFEEILLQSELRELDTAMQAIFATIRAAWERTKAPTPSGARFISQLGKRLNDVYAIHPDFKRPDHTIGSVAVQSFPGIVEQVRNLDDELLCPFSVFIHGDMNVDNIIYDAERQEVHFIDLHRSSMMDYVQDVSVFLVSNYRLQALQNPVRSRLNLIMERFFEFVREFARDSEDTTFQARLCLGLARSFVTSTRFVLDRDMAKSMFFRARYLLDQLVATDRQELADFRVPLEVLLD